MLPGANAVGLLQQYLRGDAPLIDTRLLPGTEEPLFSVGERLQAIVRNELPGGRFVVQIKDQLLDLNLPRNTEPGAALELEVVATHPGLRFALLQSGSAAQPSTSLSTAARALAELLRPADTKAGALTDGKPLLSVGVGATPDTQQLATRLAQTINDSGLFYESHQADWARGERPLQSLLREPQNKPAETLDTRSGVNVSAAVSGTKLDETKAVLGQLVQRQLDTLDQGAVLWQGQAWPGQPLRWALQAEAQTERDAAPLDEQAPSRWQTRLDLDLPRLGAVSVQAELRNGQFSLRFISAEADTRAAISAGQSALQARFAAAGLALAGTPAVVAGEANE
ncbi:hypothetical protein JHS3_10910 [Jeongeupia sp. HS-3]|uniref:flagellar hook-length control protein FliK n=1 Tax=Jeongeupia sp. HS-3 TaxID=1009682 RepID=UPI0018A66C98|nr:flagellar hook-length control protein FliK [Jeongeupia sp. HS-3]BCL75355.1 hypothetical protein JHS3_10910 [Jeongeupia sp. HS-3]